MTKRLKVLASAFACAPQGGSEHLGGGEMVLGWNAVQQLARFHDVWVLTHADNRDPIEKVCKRGEAGDLRFCYIQLPGLLERLKLVQGGIQFYAYLWQVRAYFVARKLHREVGFELFHHVTYANDWMASYIGTFLPVPYIRGPGGGAHQTPKAFLREYPFRARLWERFRTFGQRVLRLDPVFILGQRRAKVILLCNREAQEAVPQSLRHKVQLFPVNGISARDFRGLGGENHLKVVPEGRSCDRASSASFEVLYAGKLLGLKGVALGIRAFAKFAGHHSDARFTIVGEGPERPRLETLIAALGVKQCVHLQRWVPHSEVPALMRESDVFLFPSLRDGGGAVVVEAMAAGKPVICMDLAGPGLHVTPECGIKIPARYPEETIELMAQALERLYLDRKLCLKMGLAGRARAEQVYSWDHLGERLLKIYQQVAGTPSPEA